MIHPAKEEEGFIAKSSSASSNWAETKQVNSLFQLCTAPKSIEQELSAAKLVSVSGLPSYLVARVCALKKKKKNTVGNVVVQDTIMVDQLASVASNVEFPLWSLEIVDKAKTAVTVTACVRPLVSALKCRRRGDDADVAKANAAGVLFVLVSRCSGKGAKQHRATANAAAIVKAGAIGPLVELCRSGDAGGKEYAAGALWNLAHCNTANKVAIAKAGAIGPLVELCRGGDAGGKCFAAYALRNLAWRNADNKAAIAKARGAK